MRSILHFAIFVPALAGAALYTGTVNSLENQPIAGVVVKLASDSVVTGHDGIWSLARTAGIQSRDAQAIDGTRHLVRDGFRLSLTWQDHDILGRGAGTRLNLSSNQRTAIAARTMAATSTDTIVIRWKGKNLSRIPVSASDTTIAQVIDTSWKNDAGIPWNPRITYGSLPDTRDGQTYRTVKIGTQTWMAENLNYRTDSSFCYNYDTANCAKVGRLYRWAAAMGLNDSCNTKPCSSQVTSKHQGACPTGWHVPSDAEWTKLTDTTLVATTAGKKLKSAMGWNISGIGPNEYGFTALPAGIRGDGGLFGNVDYSTYFWSASEIYWSFVWGRYIYDGGANVGRGYYDKSVGFSLRCLED